MTHEKEEIPRTVVNSGGKGRDDSVQEARGNMYPDYSRQQTLGKDSESDLMEHWICLNTLRRLRWGVCEYQLV